MMTELKPAARLEKMKFMLHLCPCPFVVALLLIPGLVNAKVTTISSRTESSPSEQARFVEMKKEVVLPRAPKTEISYLTDTRFAYTAPSPALIESLAVVQWIRGCLFESEFKGGHIEKHLNIVRQHFGKVVVFRHPHWQIDSDSTDPIYSSDLLGGSFALLRWNSDPYSLDPETATLYGQAKPPHGSVFVTELPGSAFLASGSGNKAGQAQNTSLEFQTCLFRTVDLPATTTPDGDGVDQSKALWCVSWDHKFVWNFKTAQMDRPPQIDPVCLDKSPEILN
jgi:hypothetical protein